eukprot:7655810-Lingulodinium_polyedra.AAC.1
MAAHVRHPPRVCPGRLRAEGALGTLGAGGWGRLRRGAADLRRRPYVLEDWRRRRRRPGRRGGP